MDFNKKGNREFFNDKLLFKTVGVIFLVIIVLFAIADFKIYQKKKELIVQINAYQKQIEDIQKSSEALKTEIANSDNKDYLEKLGYEQFGQARPGETVYSFIMPPDKPKATVAKPQNFWFSWLGWLKSKI